MNISWFRLSSLVIHEVPQPDDDGDGLILTDSTVPLDLQLRSYFERKVVQSLETRGLAVIADPPPNPP